MCDSAWGTVRGLRPAPVVGPGITALQRLIFRRTRALVNPAGSVERISTPRRPGGGPPADLEEGHRAAVCCHLANIAYRVGRKPRWDGARGAVLDDAEASTLLDRPQRKGYELPQ